MRATIPTTRDTERKINSSKSPANFRVAAIRAGATAEHTTTRSPGAIRAAHFLREVGDARSLPRPGAVAIRFGVRASRPSRLLAVSWDIAVVNDAD